MNSKILKIFFLAVVLVVGIAYRENLKSIWAQSFYQYFPCKQPITYSIGTFDKRFGISKEDFIKAIGTAEGIWEKPIGKNLFEYSMGGDLKINLIYDIRQEATNKLKSLGYVVDNTKASYDLLNSKYKLLIALHKQNTTLFNLELKNFDIRKKTYENSIVQANMQKNVTEETISNLNNERNSLNQDSALLKQMQNNLNNEVAEINTLATTVNRTASYFNAGVENFNTIGKSFPSEFDEGIYKSGPSGQEIDIYQYDNQTKLIRVLAHELGHALGLDHVDDSKAIMYSFNNGINEKLVMADLSELKNKCRIK